MVRSIITEAGGTISIATSDKSITFSNGIQDVNDCNIKGTLLRIRVDLEQLAKVDFNRQLDEVTNQAKLLGISSAPSGRSKTLKNLI
ncbi:hypothetical protein [Paraliobacillus sp. JSM ZJ581]|uniref:hypothetical protein n=1 Tax=Paraliobacillus sp. JSM ZJ581 TaxID=3342118 RepID=UPI0035A8FD8F